MTELKKNLAQHVKDYDEAVLGYQRAAIAAVSVKKVELESNAIAPLYFDLVIPKSHEKAYKHTIRMMELETRDEIDLTIDQFGCFVMDDWTWKQEFVGSTMRYK